MVKLYEMHIYKPFHYFNRLQVHFLINPTWIINTLDNIRQYTL
jgi:hypothetical protein